MTAITAPTTAMLAAKALVGCTNGPKNISIIKAITVTMHITLFIFHPQKKAAPKGRRRLPTRNLLEDPDSDTDHDDRAENGKSDGQDGGDCGSCVTGDGREGCGQSGDSAGSAGLRNPSFHLMIFMNNLTTSLNMAIDAATMPPATKPIRKHAAKSEEMNALS
jgi:hypothetical protein